MDGSTLGYLSMCPSHAFATPFISIDHCGLPQCTLEEKPARRTEPFAPETFKPLASCQGPRTRQSSLLGDTAVVMLVRVGICFNFFFLPLYIRQNLSYIYILPLFQEPCSEIIRMAIADALDSCNSGGFRCPVLSALSKVNEKKSDSRTQTWMCYVAGS